jgi:uncharacterized protein (TIGR03437 family)
VLLAITATASQPVIAPNGVISASGFGGFTSVAPGSWIEIYGSSLAVNTRSWTSADFAGSNAPTALDGTSVTIGGQAAFIDYISPSQVNVQVPSNVASGPQPVVVSVNGSASTPYNLTVNTQQPGLLAPPSFKAGSTQYVVALFSDGVTYALPPGTVAGVASRRAVPGDTITLYGVGFGAVVPAIPAGRIVQEANSLATPLKILFGQAPATITYQGLAPNFVGLYQVNVVVPQVSGSDVPLTFELGGAAGTQKLSIGVAGSGGPLLQSVTVSSASVTGGGMVQGTVNLSQPAPAGGAVVALASNSGIASVPSTVTVPAAAMSASFSISTTAVTSSGSATITASYAGASVQAVLTVTPPAGLPKFTLLQITGSMTLTNGSMVALGVNLSQLGPPAGNTCGFSGAWKEGSADFLANAQWNGWSGSGLTVTCSNFNIVGSTVRQLNGTQMAEFTAGSLSVTLNPQVVSTSETVSGSINLVSTVANVSGSFTGSYIVILQ